MDRVWNSRVGIRNKLISGALSARSIKLNARFASNEDMSKVAHTKTYCMSGTLHHPTGHLFLSARYRRMYNEVVLPTCAATSKHAFIKNMSRSNATRDTINSLVVHCQPIQSAVIIQSRGHFFHVSKTCCSELMEDNPRPGFARRIYCVAREQTSLYSRGTVFPYNCNCLVRRTTGFKGKHDRCGRVSYCTWIYLFSKCRYLPLDWSRIFIR